MYNLSPHIGDIERIYPIYLKITAEHPQKKTSVRQQNHCYVCHSKYRIGTIMSQAQRIKIPRASDGTIIDCFRKLGNLYGVTSINVSALGFAQIGAVELSEENSEPLKDLLSHDSAILNTCSLAISGLSVSYHRGGQYPPEQQSPIYDEILLNWNQQGKLENKEKIAIVSLINTDLKASHPGRFIDTGLSKEQSELLSIHESTLERLEKLNENLVRQSSEFREQIEKRFEEKVDALEKETKEKQEKVEQNYSKKAELLQEKEIEIKSKLDAIDDRDNTHVRREIRDKMLDDVKNRISKFGVSEATEKKRAPVFIGIIGLILASFFLMLFTGYEINTAEKNYTVSLEATKANKIENNEKSAATNPTVEFAYVERAKVYWLWARFALFSFALLGTILYYIKWQNKWAEHHSSSEFQLQQFYIDVNRANWVIESCLEWRKETESAIPTELLKSITRNLFVAEQSESEQVIHPADELASALLGSASKLKLNMNGNELEFNKPTKISKKATTVQQKVIT